MATRAMPRCAACRPDAPSGHGPRPARLRRAKVGRGREMGQATHVTGGSRAGPGGGGRPGDAADRFHPPRKPTIFPRWTTSLLPGYPSAMPPPFADALFWIAVALCAVAQLALLHSFFLGASRPRRDAAPGFRATETLWAVVPAVVLVLLLAGTRQAMDPGPVLGFAPADAPTAAVAP